MALTTLLDVKNQNPSATLNDFFRAVLETEEIGAVLAPRKLPVKNVVMPALIAHPDQMEGVDPLAPYFPMNAAKIASRLFRKPGGAKTAAVLRPCEIRAFVELVKLHQGTTDEAVIIGVDCLGAYMNKDYPKAAGADPDAATKAFVKAGLAGETPEANGAHLATACQACEHPVPEGADILIGLFGMNVDKQIMVQGLTEKGENLLRQMELPEADPPAERKAAADKVIAARKTYRDAMYEETKAATDSLEKLTAYLAGCVNCYNCRVACPVCYCKECVFVTDVFNHEPSQYLRWAARKGAIKMPTDTVFYHVTRLAHMSTACVGCGQCSNACPNDIPVMELFRTVARDTQKAFDYEAGRSLEEKPPLSVFREQEFSEVVGIK